MALTARVLLALVAALAAGTVLSLRGDGFPLRAALALEPIGTAWVNAIRMTVVPLVLSLLIAGIASARPEAVARLGGRALALFAGLAGLSTVVLFVAGPPLFRTMQLAPETVAAMREQAIAVEDAATLPPPGEWLVGLIPSNPVRAAAEGEMLPLVVFAALFGLALTRLPEERRRAVSDVFQTVADATFVLVGWILAAAPVGVFFLVLPLAARAGPDLAGAMGGFLLIVFVLLAAVTLLLYPLAALAGGVSLRRFARACVPPQAVGFGTRSSLASLPAMLEAAERRLELPVRVTGLVLPFAVSVFKFGSPIVRGAGSLFVARLYGIELGGAELALFCVLVGVLSFYSPGIPSGGLLVLAPLFASFGLPIEGIGLLIALDMIPDMVLTASNVTADMAVATILARPARAEAGAAAPVAAARSGASSPETGM